MERERGKGLKAGEIFSEERRQVEHSTSESYLEKSSNDSLN